MWVFRPTTVIFAGAMLLPTVALAGEPPKSAEPAAAPTPGEPKAEALKHFERARELYRDGSYKEAIVELEAAHALDRDAKDLVYNLALVNEKLIRIDDALRWMRQYSEMDLDQAERGRAELAIRRLEGAKKTLAEQRAADEKAAKKATPERPTPTPMGRIDALTITAGAVSVVGLGVGSVAGILALSQKPKAGYVTGQSGTYQQLSDEASRAHTKAIVADVELTSSSPAAPRRASSTSSVPRTRTQKSRGLQSRSRSSRRRSRTAQASSSRGRCRDRTPLVCAGFPSGVRALHRERRLLGDRER
ncbi:MAG: tetratricopeptide repeat protein [Polyangiaceae bacterium]